MPLARVGEIELSYERAGSGPPMLVIMGMSGTFDHWDAGFLEDLRRDFEVIVYDHRGVGSSTRLGQGRLTIAQLAEDAAGLLAALRGRLRPRAGHLDGRDGRPGARAGPPRAHRHADARLHLLRRRGQRARRRGGDAQACRGDVLRCARARDPRCLGGERLSGVRGERARHTRASWGSACAVPCRS